MDADSPVDGIDTMLTRDKLLWMTKSRAALIVVIFVSFVLISTLGLIDYPLIAVTGVAIAVEAITFGFYYVYDKTDRLRAVAVFHLIFDTALIGSVVYLSGDAESPFIWLFALAVIAAGTSLGSAAGYIAAVVCSSIIALLLLGDVYGFIGGAIAALPGARVGIERVLIEIFAGVGLCFSTAVATGFMADKLTEVAHTASDRSRVLAQISITDNLTGLYNQRYFIDRLEQEVARVSRTGEPLSVAFFDLDNFKEVNDSFGHQAGDELLQEVATAISTTIRNGADTAFRYGGDEMVVILGGTDLLQGMVAVERIRERVRFMEVDLTFSVGIAQHIPGRSSEELLGAADHAMYEAKATGGNKIIASDWDVILTGGT